MCVCVCSSQQSESYACTEVEQPMNVAHGPMQSMAVARCVTRGYGILVRGKGFDAHQKLAVMMVH
jgi:hypothetical protein